MELPRISVVTPSYNQAKFIERTIKSVLNQNYPNLEYIIIDGDSTDGSVDIIREYSDQLHYWISEKDEGQTQAINKGFRQSTGEIVAWLNSDDEYCEGALDFVSRTFMANKDVDVVFGNKLTVYGDGNVMRVDRHTRFAFPALLVLGQTVSQPACFWKRSVFERFGFLDESFRFCMDFEFFCRTGPYLKWKHVNRCLAKFRWHSDQKTNVIFEVRDQEEKRIRAKYLGDACKGFPVWLVRAGMHLYRAFWYTVQGDAFYVVRGICRRLLPKKLRPRRL